MMKGPEGKHKATFSFKASYVHVYYYYRNKRSIKTQQVHSDGFSGL